MTDQSISPADPHPRKRVSIAESEASYVDTGHGSPIVFLHGNPTSSYLWRNIIPYLTDTARCLAPDLLGMGDSGKATDGSYRFIDHSRYLDLWFDRMGIGNDVTLVMHDWGSALGFYWAHRHQDRIKGLVYMEAIVRPLTWDEWPEQARAIFQGMRSPAGEDMVLQKNIFVERILPGSILRSLTDEEKTVYQHPYTEPGESRRPTLTWPREIPIDGEPADVVAIVEAYSRWLETSEVPKLFINGEPGAILTGAQREYCRTWPNQQEVTVPGIHFIQEDSPSAIGLAISRWYSSLPSS